MLNMVYPALSAARAASQKLGVTANNIANVNTDGFKKSRAVIQETVVPGVEAVITQVNTPGSPIPSEGTGAFKESSNVNLEEEIPSMMESVRTYTANIKSAKAADEMLGKLFDIFA